MHYLRSLSKNTVRVISLLLVLAFLPVSTLQAAMVGTDTVIKQEQAQFDRSQILERLQAEDAKKALATLGVDKADIEDRVANMTAEELQQFNADINELPAGGLGVVGLVVFVVVLLIVLDLLGATDVFPAVKPLS